MLMNAAHKLVTLVKFIVVRIAAFSLYFQVDLS